MAQWEYCEVALVDLNLDKLSIMNYRPSGTQARETKFRNKPEAQENLRKVIARLGTEGWELLAISSDSNHYFLKRMIGGTGNLRETATANNLDFGSAPSGSGVFTELP